MKDWRKGIEFAPGISQHKQPVARPDRHWRFWSGEGFAQKRGDKVLARDELIAGKSDGERPQQRVPLSRSIEFGDEAFDDALDSRVRIHLRGRGDVDQEPRGLRFRDPWGNLVEVVQYSEVQFTKAPGVLAGMDLRDPSCG